MEGLHLTADLHDCPAGQAAMREPAALRALCVEAVQAAGLRAVGELFHPYPGLDGATPGGITGVVLLAESHLAVHTWPERRAVTLDVYVCNLGQDNSGRAQGLMDRLVAAFQPGHIERHALRRGAGASVRPAAPEAAR